METELLFPAAALPFSEAALPFIEAALTKMCVWGGRSWRRGWRCRGRRSRCTCICPSVPLSRCAAVLLCRCAAVPLCLCAGERRCAGLR
eukprot:3135212-Rhodomonas_salina.1